jgi:hypothetical protein
MWGCVSALGRFAGVDCVPCRWKGHKCQAQIVAPVEIIRHNGERLIEERPMCLRCADGEPCYQESAESLETPERLREKSDLFEVPEITPEDREAIRVDRELRDWIDPEIKRSAKGDLMAGMSSQGVAEKYGLGIQTISAWKSHLVRQAQLAGKASIQTENYARIQTELAGKVGPRHKDDVQVERMWARKLRIGGKIVHMAPGAVMGAEMLNTADSGHPSAIGKEPARFFRNWRGISGQK